MLMEKELTTALEAGDGEQLLQLCCKLDRNLTLRIGGYPEGEVEQTLAHHIACRTCHLQCLEMLIHRLGPDCLACLNQYNQTPVYLAALAQDETWMQVVLCAAGTDCFGQPGQFGRTAVHAAASNAWTASTFHWLLLELGKDCLTVQDDFGDTPVHQAAIKRDFRTMELIKSLAGLSVFYQPGRCQRTAIHCAAMNRLDNSTLKWLVVECGSDCLTKKDGQGSTPIHLSALYQTDEALQFLADKIGMEAFSIKNNSGMTVAHFAAQNSSSDTTLAWCIRSLGPDCMLVSDSRGRTPAHLAAQNQGTDSISAASAWNSLKDSQESPVYHPQDDEGNLASIYAEVSSKNQRVDPGLSEILQPNSAPSIQSRNSVSELRSGNQNPASGLAASSKAPAKTERTGRRASEASNLASNRNSFEFRQQQSVAIPARRGSCAETLSLTLLDASFSTWDFILDRDGKKQFLGSGGFGKVYKVLTDRLQTVAVKIVKLNRNADPRMLEKTIERERLGIEILKDVRHQNIVHFLKYESTNKGQFCIFTELIAGHNLLDLMNRRRKPFEEAEVKKITFQVCTALNFLHNWKRPIIHRDIKCSNIMLTHESVVKLIDFGLAKEILTTTLEVSTENLGGTWYYMAPELFSDDGRIAYSPKTDVWAFGCTIFEMLHTRPPNGEVAVQLIPVRIRDREMPEISALQVSDQLKSLYRRCVVRHPGQRADTEELLRHSFLDV